MSEQTSFRSHRRQIRLRTVLVANIFFALLLFAFWSMFIQPVGIELRSARVIETFGGQVSRVDNHPAWLRRVLHGQDQRRVVIVHLEGSDITDPDLRYLTDFPKLGGLYLKRTEVTDAALATIEGMADLQDLDLSETRVSFVRLAGLTKLQQLDLSGAPVEALQLQGLTSLSKLNLSKTKIDDSDLANLSGLAALTELKICDTAVTDEGLARLETLPKLRTVWLQRTRVTAAGIARLTRSRPGMNILQY
jgi:uncharacterized protein YjbI with pentapeptide repeats